MAKIIKLTGHAENKTRGMTLGELFLFVRQLEEAPSDTKIKIVGNWSSGIKRIEVEYVEDEDNDGRERYGTRWNEIRKENPDG